MVKQANLLSSSSAVEKANTRKKNPITFLKVGWYSFEGEYFSQAEDSLKLSLKILKYNVVLDHRIQTPILKLIRWKFKSLSSSMKVVNKLYPDIIYKYR